MDSVKKLTSGIFLLKWLMVTAKEVILAGNRRFTKKKGFPMGTPLSLP
jgi:hypothetical protein